MKKRASVSSNPSCLWERSFTTTAECVWVGFFCRTGFCWRGWPRKRSGSKGEREKENRNKVSVSLTPLGERVSTSYMRSANNTVRYKQKQPGDKVRMSLFHYNLDLATWKTNKPAAPVVALCVWELLKEQ